ncbi:MAG: hypothetical protein NUW01_09045 [Gemmatimonadaceae bacterium]|nr:hypothetical protein [Gemmatimonadaceae bacterium]
MSMYDTDRPGYSVDRIYEAADFMVKERKENPPENVVEQVEDDNANEDESA